MCRCVPVPELLASKKNLTGDPRPLPIHHCCCLPHWTTTNVDCVISSFPVRPLGIGSLFVYLFFLRNTSMLNATLKIHCWFLNSFSFIQLSLKSKWNYINIPILWAFDTMHILEPSSLHSLPASPPPIFPLPAMTEMVEGVLGCFAQWPLTNIR